MLHKTYSDAYVILFTIPFAYAHPQVDNVPITLQVDTVDMSEHEHIVTLDQAVELYLAAHRQQFTNPLGIVRKKTTFTAVSGLSQGPPAFVTIR